jgi:hypothetical protein
MTDLITVDPDVFAENFGRAPFTVRHTLSEHSLLTIEALAELADFLPSDLVEHNLSDLPKVLEARDRQLQTLDQSPGEIARGIETNGCWMVLKEIEHHPAYRDLLNSALDEVSEQVRELDGPMVRRLGFVFLSAPNSMTPLHIDNEHNLLLQIRGEKRVGIGRFRDPNVENEELERLYEGVGTRYLEREPEAMEEFDLQPGDGVSVPLSFPHWVRSGDGVSISLSVTFQTPRSLRRAQVYALNARLRRLHIAPRAPDKDGVRDHVKAAAYRAGRVPVWLARSLRSRRGAAA